MENLELLQAMRQMMEEVVSPIYERLDKMDERLDKINALMALNLALKRLKLLPQKLKSPSKTTSSPKSTCFLKGKSPSKIAFRSWIAWKKCCGDCGMMCKICNTLYRGIVAIFAGSSAVVTQIKSKPNSNQQWNRKGRFYDQS